MAKDSTKVIEKKVKVGWGRLAKPKKFTKQTRQFINRSLSAIQKEYGRENLRFLTQTLPGSTKEAIEAFAKYNAYAMNRINTWLKRKLGEDAKCRVSVWELQKRGALHNHIVIASKDKQKLEKIDEGFQSFCYQLFLDIGEKANVDMFKKRNGQSWKDNPEVLRCTSEKVNKDVSRYMSKYMSKTDSKLNNKSNKKEVIYYPSVWASWGRGAKKLLSEKTVEICNKRTSGENANELANLCIYSCEEHSEEKYSKPLIYKDLEGGGVNIKMFVKEGHLEAVVNDIQALMDCCSEEKSVEINTELPPFEMVVEKALDEAFAELANQEIRARYGIVDSRLWQKAFRKNHAPLPQKENMELWRKYYAEQKRLLALTKKENN